MGEKSVIDVIIPVYNGELYIKEAIDSILNQTFQDFTIIVVDDASSDRSVELIQDYRDKRIQIFQNEKNMGIAFSRNRALDLCKGEYIALMDHDDIAVPERLAHELAFFRKNPNFHVVGGHTRRIDKKGKDMHKQWTVFLNPAYIKAYMLLGNAIVNTSAMVKRSFLEEHRIRYRDEQMGAEDYRFWIDCMLAGAEFANLDEVLVYWRNGHNNVTMRISEEQYEQRFKVISDIHTQALRGSGFQLTQEEYSLLNQAFMEEGSIENEEQMKELYCILKKIACQARQMNLSNANEIVTMCRKRFGEKVGKAFYLWE